MRLKDLDCQEFQSLFYWIIYSYMIEKILNEVAITFQSLFYWIIYSYNYGKRLSGSAKGVSILILLDYLFLYFGTCLTTRKIYVVSILILLDYLFLLDRIIRFMLLASLVSILILLDYLFLLQHMTNGQLCDEQFQSLFYWIIYSYRRRIK